MSYTELYKSNAELTNQVKTLTDSLVHYRTTESKLQKSLMLAEKNAEEATKNANDKAKIIENDAKIKANNIVHQAREELDRIEDSIEGIKQQYRDYTMAFKNLMDSHLQFLATNPINEELGVDFDEIMKDAKYFNGNAAVYTPGSSGRKRRIRFLCILWRRSSGQRRIYTRRWRRLRNGRFHTWWKCRQQQCCQ